MKLKNTNEIQIKILDESELDECESKYDDLPDDNLLFKIETVFQSIIEN